MPKINHIQHTLRILMIIENSAGIARLKAASETPHLTEKALKPFSSPGLKPGVSERLEIL